MTQKTYIVRPGHSFRGHKTDIENGALVEHVFTAGEEIELDSDVAMQHAYAVDPKPEPEAEAEAALNDQHA